MSQKTTGSPPIRLSIVIPVYNSPEHVRTAVEIAASQTCEGGVTEVIVVDDGSTDETPTVLAQLEGEHTNLRVIRQENSGWAGAPRNAGLDVARGDYVFFHDADDRLNGDCLGSAVAYADEKSSDVVLVRIEGRGGRRTHADVFADTQDDGDIRRLVRSNFCFKLFRRAFLTARGLRFPAHRIRLEDAQFCFRAYASAERVSILADRTCYFVYDHGGGHISQMGAEPRLHAEGIRESLTPLSSGPWGDELRREAMADFFRRVTLNRFNDSFDNRSIGFRLSWIEESRRLVEEFCLPDRLFEFYSPLNRARAWSLATGNPALVEAVSRRGNRSRAVLAHVDEVRLRKLSVEVEGTAAAVLATDDLSRLTLQLRKGDEELAQIDAELLDAPDSEGSADRAANAVRRFRAVIPLKTLLSQGSAKVYVRAIDSAGAETGFIRVGLNESAHLSTRRLGLTFDAGSTTLGGMNLHVSSGLKAVARSVLGRNGRPAG
ncbi:glycosyltransferase family 2 protein [Brevibacterium metallidurans]|uniref:Glycosyltransferase 2-like domain-containing protein n=1 Tax=Brevibacterium metallidurans TaxID=1482676 RepID=A0ABP3C5X6_9MICO